MHVVCKAQRLALACNDFAALSKVDVVLAFCKQQLKFKTNDRFTLSGSRSSKETAILRSLGGDSVNF